MHVKSFAIGSFSLAVYVIKENTSAFSLFILRLRILFAITWCLFTLSVSVRQWNRFVSPHFIDILQTLEKMLPKLLQSFLRAGILQKNETLKVLLPSWNYFISNIQSCITNYQIGEKIGLFISSDLTVTHIWLLSKTSSKFIIVDFTRCWKRRHSCDRNTNSLFL